MRKVLKLASVSSMIEAFNRHNIQLLQELGYEVHVAANFQEDDPLMQKRADAFKEQLQNEGVVVIDLPFHRNPLSIENLTAYRSLKKIIDQQQYDMIHCHSPVGGALGRLAARQTRKNGTKVLYTAHGFHFFKGASLKNWLLYYPVEKVLSTLTDCLITINPEDYQQAYHRKFRSKRIEKINGVGIDLNKFALTNEDRRKSLRRAYGYNEHDKLLVYVGELSHRKNQAFAIRLMSHVVKQVPSARLLLVGDGDKEKELEKMIYDLKLQNHVQLLGFRRDVPELMALSDMALSTSRQEGLPVNVMEAMATGLPLVVSNCRGNRDLVQNGANGYVMEEMDEEQFAYRILTLLSSEDLRIRFGMTSARLIEAYSYKQVDNSMRRIYKFYSQFTPVFSQQPLIAKEPSNKEPV